MTSTIGIPIKLLNEAQVSVFLPSHPSSTTPRVYLRDQHEILLTLLLL
jgi:hypothetical protein